MKHDNLERIKVVYRPDGCVDFATTKAVSEGTALTPADLAEVDLSYSANSLDTWEREQTPAEEFWGDSCFTEPLFSSEGKKLQVKTEVEQSTV
jgi:hypothetical protein